MSRPNILLICGSLNQTQQMHQIARHLQEYNCFFTPFYADGLEDFAARQGWLNATVLGGRHLQDTQAYLAQHHLPLDVRGGNRSYDLVLTCSDLIVPKNILRRRLVLVQEGITVPEGLPYHLVRNMRFLPRYLANTAATGLSDAYDLFCVASEGYRQLFIQKGVRPEKIAVTGIPNFDNFKALLEREFPFRGFVLVATSPLRESAQPDDRAAFFRKCVEIAAGRPLIIKLHPLENESRARREIQQHIPTALVLTCGNINPLIANAEVVITQQSSCTYVALALGKETHSQLDHEELKRLMPIQNGGDSARRIALLARRILHTPMPVIESYRRISRSQPRSPAWDRHIPKGRWEVPGV